jgi:hypothetical protein
VRFFVLQPSENSQKKLNLRALHITNKMNPLAKYTLIGAAGITGLYWLRTRECVKECTEFNKSFRNLSKNYFIGRSLNARINLTYLYRYDALAFEKQIREEHNACFDEFKASKIGDYRYGTCVACKPYAVEHFNLAHEYSQILLHGYPHGYTSWKEVEHSGPNCYVEFHRGFFATKGTEYRPSSYRWSGEDYEKFVEQGKADRKILEQQKRAVEAERARDVELLPEIKKHPLLHIYIRTGGCR